MSNFKKKIKWANKQWAPPMFEAPVSFTPINTSQPPMFKVCWWGSAPIMEIVHRGSECTWSAGNFLREWAPKRLDGNSFPEWTSSVHRFRVFCSCSTSTGTPKSGNCFRPCVRNNSRCNGLNLFRQCAVNVKCLTNEHSTFEWLDRYSMLAASVWIEEVQTHNPNTWELCKVITNISKQWSSKVHTKTIC